ncbi:MAG: FHA domain-containing protein [Anaerolineales bacterium]|jgi:pSer/pThr/pTyr-binding forkhead associated (FHA) protein
MTDPDILGWLKGDTPNVQGQEFALNQREVIIGRGTRCDVQLSDPKISRQHARLRFDEHKVLLEDLGSAHGTLVNGERGGFFILKDGDVIAMGDTLLVFKASPDTMATLMAPDLGQPVRPPAVQAPIREQAQLQSPKPPMSGTQKRSGMKMFLLGLIPVLLIGVAAIAAFILLGGEPEQFEPAAFPDEQVSGLPTEPQATVTETASKLTEEVVVDEEAIVEMPTSDVPAFTIRPRDLDADEDVLFLTDVSNYNEAESGVGQVVFDAEITVGRDYGFGYYQCAVDEATLKDNLSSFTVDFVGEGLAVGLDDLTFSEWDRGDRYCYYYDGVLTALSVGSYELLMQYVQSEEYFDGFDTYPPETLETLYRINVVNAAEVSGGKEGPRVTLHVGDARFFSIPPDALAYANTQYKAPPAEIMVMDNCGSSGCWRYNEWLAMGEPGQYIQVDSAVSTTAIGVQLWGDDNDGWARVLVDGEEMWTGEMRGEDNQWPGGAFVRYLEVSGLEPGPHSLRFEPTGQGGSVTVYFFGIGEVNP